jgi:hypothetical protein
VNGDEAVSVVTFRKQNEEGGGKELVLENQT